MNIDLEHISYIILLAVFLAGYVAGDETRRKKK
jgi:hypothetical protein